MHWYRWEKIDVGQSWDLRVNATSCNELMGSRVFFPKNSFVINWKPNPLLQLNFFSYLVLSTAVLCLEFAFSFYWTAIFRLERSYNSHKVTQNSQGNEVEILLTKSQRLPFLLKLFVSCIHACIPIIIRAWFYHFNSKEIWKIINEETTWKRSLWAIRVIIWSQVSN